MLDLSDEAFLKRLEFHTLRAKELKDLLDECSDVIDELIDHCQDCDYGEGMEHINIMGRASNLLKKINHA